MFIDVKISTLRVPISNTLDFEFILFYFIHLIASVSKLFELNVCVKEEAIQTILHSILPNVWFIVHFWLIPNEEATNHLKWDEEKAIEIRRPVLGINLCSYLINFIFCCTLVIIANDSIALWVWWFPFTIGFGVFCK